MRYPLPTRIALRYLLSRKSHAAVNVISAVAVAGVTVAAAAMIVVMSVFNGFSQLVYSKTAGFNPPLIVEAADGSVLPDADSLCRAIAAAEPSVAAFPLIDAQAFAVSTGGQMPVNIRAIPYRALQRSGIPDIIIDGSVHPSSAIVSVGVAMQTGVRPPASGSVIPAGSYPDSLSVYFPRRLGRVNPANPAASFRGRELPVCAVYQVEQEEQDRDMMIIPLEVARELLDYTTEATAVALYPPQDTPAAIASVEKALRRALPDSYTILDRQAQERDAYRMISIEKWITFLMLLFILAVASFNITTTLSLMIVEKRANMDLLRAMGGEESFIRRIFAWQGGIITLVGGVVGIIIGALLTLGQATFGWIKLASQNPALMAIDRYPVELSISDLLVTLLAISLLSAIMSLTGYMISRSSSSTLSHA